MKRRRSQLMKRAIGVIPLQVAKHSVSEDLITLRILQRFPEVYLQDVVVKDNVMTFSFVGGGTTDIPLLGGLNMTFADGATSLTSVTIAKNTLKELKVEQINVDKIIIDPTPLMVDLTDTSLTIQTTGVDPGVYDVHFQIFSKEGYRLIKSLKVTVSE